MCKTHVRRGPDDGRNTRFCLYHCRARSQSASRELTRDMAWGVWSGPNTYLHTYDARTRTPLACSGDGIAMFSGTRQAVFSLLKVPEHSHPAGSGVTECTRFASSANLLWPDSYSLFPEAVKNKIDVLFSAKLRATLM